MAHRDSSLARDVRAMLARCDRRQLVQWMAGVSVLPLLGCGVRDARDADADAGAACAALPEETAGPFPGDGSIGPNALVLAGIVRTDLRASFGVSSGVADGTPFTLQLRVVGAATGCAPSIGRAVYVWHCDRDGKYSLYTAPEANYLRGVQETDAEGLVTFTTIFPGCYPGRWPHIHVEVYPSLAQALGAATVLATSQLALPASACAEVYATAGYASSATSLEGVSLAGDLSFQDGSVTQTPIVSGNASEGYVATLTIAIAS